MDKHTLIIGIIWGLAVVALLSGLLWALDREGRIADQQIERRIAEDRRACALTINHPVWQSSPMCQQVREYDSTKKQKGKP